MPEAGHIQRHFLGASSPALPAAAHWLIHALPGGPAALSGALVVVPGGRAQRRLMELLAERSEGLALTPPTIVTLGALADRLLATDGPTATGGLATLLAWASVLREAEPELLAQVVPHAPARDDWPAWWTLAEQVTQCADELGAQLLLIQDVAERLTHRGDAPRWEALAELDRRYHALVAERGGVDRHVARRDAIAPQPCAFAGTVELSALEALQQVHGRMLSCMTTPIHALVFADESEAQGFDPMGKLVASYWCDRPLVFDDSALVFVDRPSDQASAVLSAIDAWSQAGNVSADMITVGLGDTSLNGPVARTLELAGLPVRSAMGKPIGRSRPVMLLEALATFANGLRFDKLAALLRHPDMEAYIARVAEASTRHWLTLLDRYATDHLAARPTGGWLGDPQTVSDMDAVYRAARSLLPEPVNGLRSLADWAEPISQALAAVYGSRQYNRFADDDRPVVEALDAIAGVLAQFGSLDSSHAPHCTFAHAVALAVRRLSGQLITEPGGEPAIELVGYLELLLDDATCLALAGLNEQHVPEPPRNSALLPEGVRRELALPGESHRLARDGYALSAMLGSRGAGAVRLIAGRRSLAGDPLLPSRLLLRDDDDTLVQRVWNFVAEQGETHIAAPLMLTPGKYDRFLIPMPVLPDEPITGMSVTAFRDYLACPYRFYLKHIRRLEALRDDALEVSAKHFGTLAHKALQTLAMPDMRAVDDIEAIQARLSQALNRTFHQAYGSDPPIAARIQIEQLRYRLESFAKVQAGLVRDGWSITDHEQTCVTTILVDGQPFTIRGQIDRIDEHADGRKRIIDYKTADTAKRPDQTHYKTINGARAWVDLQLPLYLDLIGERSAELGYINLPKKADETGYSAAQWTADELESASETRDWVIRRVRAGVFWPPNEPPVFDDGLAQLCGDSAIDRPGLIRNSTQAHGGVDDA